MEDEGAMNGPGHILVAEDNATDAFFLQRAFSRGGVPVTLQFVRDGQEVIDYLQGVGAFADRSAHPIPRLLLLDLELPRMTGFEVLSWIRKQSALDELQVVIFSGSNEPKDVRRAYGLGANSYWVKPHSIAELNALVGRFKTTWGEAGEKASQRESTVTTQKR
jgi:CheY-like chemotaxis protein